MEEMIQPGWEVIDSQGESLGQIGTLEGDVIVVDGGGLLGGDEYRIQRTSIERAENGQVFVSLSREQLEGGTRAD